MLWPAARRCSEWELEASRQIALPHSHQKHSQPVELKQIKEKIILKHYILFLTSNF